MTLNVDSPLAWHRVLSPTCSLKVSPICLGTMNFGKKLGKFMGDIDKDTVFGLLDEFRASGGNFVDTAAMYMFGESEEWLGDWMESRKCRDQMVVGTKYGIPQRFKTTLPPGSKDIISNESGNNSKTLRMSLKKSLCNLRTDYVDILYVHGWDNLASIPEIMRSLDDVVRTGQVLYLGISNTPAWIVVKANDFARQHGLSPFVVYQGRWNPAEREIEREIVPMCVAEGMAITVWSPMAGGKFRIGQKKVEGGRNFDDAEIGGADWETCQSFALKMEEVGKRSGYNAMAVALRYSMLKVPYVFPVIGGRKIEHLRSNIEALRLDLTEEDIEEIESTIPFDFAYPQNIMSKDRHHRVSSSQPSALVRYTANFHGVREPAAIRHSEII